MKGVIAWFAKNTVAANLLMMLCIAGGLAAIPAIQQKTFPDINIEIIQIAVPYLGAAPEEVEEGVCIRIEEEIYGIEGVERITSSAAEGACGVTAELLDGYPTDRALAEIKNAVDSISTFPAETEKPIISHFSMKRNALQLVVSGDASERALRVWGEHVRDEISALPGVTQVELTGARDYEVSIEVPEHALRRHGLTFDQVVAAVRRSSLDLPGGSIRTQSGEILLRAKGQAYRGEDFERLVLLTREDGTRLLLGDVANVVDGFVQDERSARFNGEPSVMIRVYRVGDQRVLELVDTVLTYVQTATQRLPEGLHLTVWQNQGSYLKDRLGILVKNGRGGFILVFVVLALFLRLRLALWVALGVPISILGALAMFPVAGLSIDVLTLFAFILVLGLLVDDAIVVGENVHTHQERDEAPLPAAIAGAQEVSIPVIFGVLTTIVAFMPMIFSPGMMADFFGAIAKVVGLCLVFSLVESQLILPAHLGHHVRAHAAAAAAAPAGTIRAGWKRLQGNLASSLTRLAQKGYQPLLERAIEWRYATVSMAVALLMLTAGAMASGWLPFSFFPSVESDYVSASVTMPLGTPADVTRRAVLQLEESANQMKTALDEEFRTTDGRSLIQHRLATVGEHPAVTGGPPRPAGLGGTHLGGVVVELVSGNDRPPGFSSKWVRDRWREATASIPGIEELAFSADYMNAGSPIFLELKSADIDQLQRASEAVKIRLAGTAGVYDITDSWRDGKQELKLQILPSAEALGLSLRDLASQVRQAFYGEEAQRIQRGRDDVKVMVRYPEQERRSLADLDELRIRTPEGGEVPFYAVAEADRGRGYATIKRADRQRVVDVTAEVDSKQTNANQILGALKAEFLPSLIAANPGLSYSFEGEQREQQKTMAGLVKNFGFALVLIYALLAIPLRSYGQPLIIMAVIPFGLVGAIAGHLLLGLQFSMMSVFGVVALSGVVVNSSLVLVHYINGRRDAGVGLVDAVREAGVARFRPIVLTSVTTFAGLSPLLWERSMGAKFLIPMAASLGFGVIFATVISLFVVPSSYVILQDLQRLWPGAGSREEKGPRLSPVALPSAPDKLRQAGGGI
ncbi:MAG: efflux RND transporter permease subunit [Deltaproteobacteria bacterium]|nr:efflux RND transporter permease subunit [Deltaproteobacteria bacterium]